eukprot:CAMPEP_0206150448 /NCGR_PEP_ID=MMETSP1473-20131121/38307_1 /ASSEMBLY_ACC=CAM_ASM_001109 /TAXON_ID=1461547 /ORGANISM="Stichococcus sp, Strain RCC1054" /LENGTH=505 /DNA_ID=CAMNT_0053547951 /DNA_START=112 /DNA_END=1630 /DNA_ORIENTATION=+
MRGLLLQASSFRTQILKSTSQQRLLNSSSRCAKDALDGLPNHEQTGVATGAGVDGPDGFDLGVMRGLLRAMGSPQRGLPVVHIAGTKGKGSVSAMLCAMLQHAGYKVGAYTSPHLLSLRERIMIDSHPISEADFDALASSSMAAVGPKSGAGPVSHFEMMTAMALQHFKDAKVDLAVVEAGLGGARDATNVFEPSQVQTAVMTSIDEEHMDALGGSLSSIAEAKAGIIKEGCPVVLGRQPHVRVKEILCRRAAQLNCTVYEEQASVWALPMQVGSSTVTQRIELFLLNGEMRDKMEIDMQLLGEHQRENAVTAIGAALALRRQGFHRLNLTSITAGLCSATLPGRFQVGRLSDGAGGVVAGVDAAHTGGSARALAATLREAFPAPRHRLAYAVAAAADKDLSAMCIALRTARPIAVAFTTVPIAGSTHRSAPPGSLLAHWQTAGFAEKPSQRMRETVQASLAGAVAKAAGEVGEGTDGSDGVICVTGSMHAVAAALQLHLMYSRS